MSNHRLTFTNGPIFDGVELRKGMAAQFLGGVLDSVMPQDDVGLNTEIVDLDGGILSPGYVDLQVNGGGGVLFNDDPSVETIRLIAAAHWALGTRTILTTSRGRVGQLAKRPERALSRWRESLPPATLGPRTANGRKEVGPAATQRLAGR